ncbi:MAG: hypothetical protein M3444_10370, partial [Acidobacteriota bacterium]|nr:hypothetical protein [Acidobacteriota bacterium]
MNAVVGGGASSIEQVLIEQNRTISKLMSQQMELLRETLKGQRATGTSGAAPPSKLKPAPLAKTSGNGAGKD